MPLQNPPSVAPSSPTYIATLINQLYFATICPKSAQSIYTGLGSLDTTTGAITINRDIINLLKDAGVWTEYPYNKPVNKNDT